jgi:hypothetical protein
MSSKPALQNILKGILYQMFWGPLSKKQVGVAMWIHIRVLYSVPLVLISVFVPVPCCFYHYGSVV